MRQWEIYDFPYPTEQNPHPRVIISSDAVLANPYIKLINCLACTSLRGDAVAKASEVMLNGADGLDGATTVKCQLMLVVEKDSVGRLGGRVSAERQRVIRRKLIDIFRLYGA